MTPTSPRSCGRCAVNMPLCVKCYLYKGACCKVFGGADSLADTGMGKGCPKSCENCRDLLCQTSPYGVYSCMGAFANFMPCVAGHIRSLGKYRQNCCWTLMHAPTHHSNNLEAAMQGSQSRAQFSNWLCYELTPSCKKKPPPLPKDRWHVVLLDTVARFVVQLSSA